MLPEQATGWAAAMLQGVAVRLPVILRLPVPRKWSWNSPATLAAGIVPAAVISCQSVLLVELYSFEVHVLEGTVTVKASALEKVMHVGGGATASAFSPATFAI